MSSDNMEAGSSTDTKRFLDLLATAAQPATSTLGSDELAKSLGIADVPTRQQALDSLEKDLLAPVRDLSGSDLWRWQM